MHFADRVIARAREIGSVVCVGIDPRFDLLPESVRRRAIETNATAAAAAAWSFRELARHVIEATAPFACVVKPQMAFYEVLGAPGIEAFEYTLAVAREYGVPSIADAKRADIGSTSEAYAQAFFGGLAIGDAVLPGAGADALTVNPYFGTDGVDPFLKSCDTRERGVFVLVRTSNPSAAELQDLACAGGPVWTHVARLVDRWGAARVGESGYSSVGAVAGATTPEVLGAIRAALPRGILLVPGYGAQGGTAADVAHAFDAAGMGAVVNASRSIVFASKGAATLADMASAAASAARAMRDAINGAVSHRRS